MGCFLQCFGLSTKRKRRKTLYKVLAAGQRDQKYATYEVLAITEEKSIIPYSEFRGRDEHKENNGVKSNKKKKKKKVTFNLNLQIYEPNPNSYQVLDNEEEEETEDTTVEPGGEGSAALAVTFPSNHRYSNCRYDYDDDDDDEEITYEESDIDDNEFDDDDDDDDWDDDGSDESLENGEAEECADNSKQKESSYPNDAESKSNLSGRERSINMHSVLIPIENLTQWKAIKAKVTSGKNRRKENVPSEQNTSTPLVSEASLNCSPRVLESNALQSKPLLQEIAVDASLSNWLVSPNYNVSTTIRCQ